MGTSLRLTVCGAGGAGLAIAADNALKGIDVTAGPSEDIIYAFVPMVRIGEALGIDLPVTRSMIEVMGVMLQRDYWTEGLDLAALGLDGLDLDGVRRFVMTGER